MAGMPKWPPKGELFTRHVHAYFDINLDIVWRTVRGDLPELISLLEPVILFERGPTPESD